jgi:hypothetical protein
MITAVGARGQADVRRFRADAANHHCPGAKIT